MRHPALARDPVCNMRPCMHTGSQLRAGCREAPAFHAEDPHTKKNQSEQLCNQLQPPRPPHLPRLRSCQPRWQTFLGQEKARTHRATDLCSPGTYPGGGRRCGGCLRPACPPARLEVVRRRASRDDGSALLSRRCSRRHGRRVAARCGAGALGPRRVGPAYNRSTGRCPRAPSSPWPPSGVVSHGFC